MAAWRIPPLLYEEWVWPIICLPLVLAVLAVKYFQKEASPRPKPHPFFARHRRAVCLVSDLVIVCFVLAMVAFVVWVSFRDFFALPTEDAFRRHMELRIAWSFSPLAWYGAPHGERFCSECCRCSSRASPRPRGLCFSSYASCRPRLRWPTSRLFPPNLAGRRFSRQYLPVSRVGSSMARLWWQVSPSFASCGGSCAACV